MPPNSDTKACHASLEKPPELLKSRERGHPSSKSSIKISYEDVLPLRYRCMVNTFEPYTFSDRLGLREFSGSDISSVHEYASDQAVTRWCTWGPNSKAQTAAFVQEAAKQQLSNVRTSYSLAATFDGRVIGSVAVWITDPEARNGELGYTFHRAYWGKGFATQYVAQLLVVGVRSLNLERITATCHLENVGSRRALEKNGFSYEGRLRSHRLDE